MIWMIRQVELVFQSTPPARGATGPSPVNSRYTAISIHAPREGGDFDDLEEAKGCSRISIHAPREGGDSRERQ